MDGEHFQQMKGQEVILDVLGMFVYVGTLTDSSNHYYILENADVHDLRDSSTTRELYVLEAKKHGVRPNRKKVLVRKNEVISISLLADVID